MCRQEFLTDRLSRRSKLEDSFFELIDIDGRDNVIPDMELQVEKLMNNAVEFLLGLILINIRNSCYSVVE